MSKEIQLYFKKELRENEATILFENIQKKTEERIFVYKLAGKSIEDLFFFEVMQNIEKYLHVLKILDS